MNNGTLGLSFWLALAGGIVAFGVSLVLGHLGLLTAAIIGAVVFAILLAVLGYAFKGQSASASGADTAAPAAAKPVAAATPAAAVQSAPVATAAAPESAKPAAAKAAAPKAAAAKPAAAKAETAAKPAAVKSAAAPKAAAATPAAAAPKAAAAAKPAAAKPAAKSPKDEAPAPGSVGKAPATLTAPNGGKADDLKIIEGIGPAMEKLVNGLGFYHYDQIASWTADELAWVDSHLGTFRGRIVRDKWQAQAKLIVSEGVPAFLERAKTNNY